MNMFKRESTLMHYKQKD